MSKKNDKEEVSNISRRQLLGGSAKLAAIAGAATVGGVAGMGIMTPKAAEVAIKAKYHVGPGDLDEYYGFWSSGQAGELRILGMASMCALVRVPVFNRCSASGW